MTTNEHTIRIMVVDDEPDMRPLFLQRFRAEIKRGEIDFVFAISAEEALRFLSAEAADVMLILSDINMPGMSGLDLLKIVKDRHQHLKVMMITAYTDEEKQTLAKQFKADDYMTKPIDFADLKARILSQTGASRHLGEGHSG